MTIAFLLATAAPAVMHTMNKPYIVSEPLAFHGCFTAVLKDPTTGVQIPLAWSEKDEVGATTDQIVALVHGLLTNGVQSLDFAIQRRSEMA